MNRVPADFAEPIQDPTSGETAILTLATLTVLDAAVGPIGHIGPIGRRLSPLNFQNQSVACEARHAPTGPRAGRAPCAHARPAPCATLWSFVHFVVKTHWQSACASTPPVSVTLCILCASLCSQESAVPPFWQSSLCSSVKPSVLLCDLTLPHARTICPLFRLWAEIMVEWTAPS